MIGAWSGASGYGKIQLKPGQVVSIGLNPIGYLLQGSKAGSKFLSVVAPHHQLLLKKAGLSYNQQVAAAQAPAHAALLDRERQRAAQGEQSPLAVVEPAPPQLEGPPTTTIVGVSLVAGVVLVAAAYFGRRRHR